MKVVDCKVVSREIDELDYEQRPSAAILAHTEVCAQCRSFYSDRVRLREMVAGLPNVDAPADFDFRLRARLANEKAQSVSGSRVFAFSIPSVALATIALLVGAGLSMRAIMGPAGDPPVAINESPRVTKPVTTATATTSPEVKETNADATDGQSDTANLPLQQDKGSKSSEASVSRGANRRRRVLRDSDQPQVVKREDLLAGSEAAAMFPLEASEPLRVSVDYATGGSRTISLPTLSFGSQQVVSRGGSPMMKTSARTVW